jgi:oxygen-independent coproporphyrinogen-3 oxidase
LIYLKVKAGIRWHDASMVCSAPCAGVSLDSSLVRKYDGFGPRYTSYPTADRFTEAFTADDLVDALLNRQAASAPLSLYVHVPFCSTICYYCACNKVLTKDHGRSAKYIRYLVKEVAILSALVSPKAPIMQLHWGGGTPTFLSADEMQLLMHALRDNFRFERHAELAIEIDPRKADAETRDRLSRQPIDQIDVD